MRVSSILFAVVILMSVISLLSIWFYPSIQDFMASNVMWNGIRSFLSEFDASSIESLDDLPDLPEQTVLVAISYLDYSDKELSRVKRFVDDGGTLLLMDDYGYGNSVLAYLGVDVRFTNKPLLDPLFCYKNHWMPRITDFAPGVKESGIKVIVLNHATSLNNTVESEVVAWSSSASFLDLDENRVRDEGEPFLDLDENGALDEGEPKGPLAVAAEFRLGKGTLLLVSDPSVIINTMVGRDDNYDFIRYLLGGEGEQKKILVDNSHLTKAPLDVSKTRLLAVREVLSSPYALLGIIAVIFATVSRYTLRKGETIG